MIQDVFNNNTHLGQENYEDMQHLKETNGHVLADSTTCPLARSAP